MVLDASTMRLDCMSMSIDNSNSNSKGEINQGEKQRLYNDIYHPDTVTAVLAYADDGSARACHDAMKSRWFDDRKLVVELLCPTDIMTMEIEYQKKHPPDSRNCNNSSDSSTGISNNGTIEKAASSLVSSKTVISSDISSSNNTSEITSTGISIASVNVEEDDGKLDDFFNSLL